MAILVRWERRRGGGEGPKKKERRAATNTAHIYVQWAERSAGSSWYELRLVVFVRITFGAIQLL